MSSIGELVEIPCNKGFFYSSIPQGVRFGEAASGEAYSLNGAEAIFTTGISLSMVPSSVSEAFFKRLLKNVSEYYEDNGVFYVNCGTAMNDLYFMFEEHWIQIRGDDLLTDISEFQDNTLCIINFLPSVDNFWVLGNPIFKDYYVYHNPDEAMLKFVPTVQRFKQPLMRGTRPTAGIQFEYDWDLVLLKLGIVIAVAIGSWAASKFVFTTSFRGVNFLNKGTHSGG